MSTSLEKFKSRYFEHKDKPTVVAFCLTGIKKTKDVLRYARHHRVEIHGDTAYYPKNRKLGRTSSILHRGKARRVRTGRGY